MSTGVEVEALGLGVAIVCALAAVVALSDTVAYGILRAWWWVVDSDAVDLVLALTVVMAGAATMYAGRPASSTLGRDFAWPAITVGVAGLGVLAVRWRGRAARRRESL